MNRKFFAGLAAGLLLTGAIGMAEATPITFDVAGANSSSVELTDQTTYLGDTYLEAQLVDGLDSTGFVLDDGESYTFDFFTLTATGDGVGTADISATLAFDEPSDPNLVGSGDGGVLWATSGTFFGRISAGILTWDDTTLPDLITLADGTTVSIDFESGLAITLGRTVTVHATITNLGREPYSVPEPTAMAMVGAGLFCISGIARKKKK